MTPSQFLLSLAVDEVNYERLMDGKNCVSLGNAGRAPVDAAPLHEAQVLYYAHLVLAHEAEDEVVDLLWRIGVVTMRYDEDLVAPAVLDEQEQEELYSCAGDSWAADSHYGAQLEVLEDEGSHAENSLAV